MSKESFLAELEGRLTGLPPSDREEWIAFYSEMIDDRAEECGEMDEAVRGIGTVEETVSRIAAETPLTTIVKERIAPKRRLRPWETVCIVLGFPVWFSLLAAAVAVIVSLYVSLWAVILSLWAAELSFAVCAVGSAAGAVSYFVSGVAAAGVMTLGAGSFLAGLAIVCFYGCAAATKGTVRLTKRMAVGVKSLLLGKERAR